MILKEYIEVELKLLLDRTEMMGLSCFFSITVAAMFKTSNCALLAWYSS
jgi:hypothetical protein